MNEKVLIPADIKDQMKELYRKLVEESGEKPKREPQSDEELLASIIYLIHKYPKLQKYITLYNLDEYFDQIEHIDLIGWATKIGKAILSDEKEKSQPSQTIIIQPPQQSPQQSQGSMPSWVWIALIAFFLLIVAVLFIGVLKS